MRRRDFRMDFKMVRVLGAVCLATITYASPAMAYLDPVSCSMISQLVLGGITGLLVVVKLYWRRFLSKVSLFQRRAKNSRDV